MKTAIARIVVVLLLSGCSTVPNGTGSPITTLPRIAYEVMDVACSAVGVAMLVDGKGFDVNRCFIKELGVWAVDASATAIRSQMQKQDPQATSEPVLPPETPTQP